MYQYLYPRPSVTCDVVVIVSEPHNSFVLLIQRAREPFKGKWALPGGFVDENEDLPDTAARELYEETGLKALQLSQLGAYGTPGRDPRGHTITIAYISVVNDRIPVTAGDDAANARWFSLDHLPDLAFDHKEIIYDALQKSGGSNAFIQNY